MKARARPIRYQFACMCVGAAGMPVRLRDAHPLAHVRSYAARACAATPALACVQISGSAPLAAEVAFEVQISSVAYYEVCMKRMHARS
eukprot:5760801-Pleurochrysis_carterae.AAC.3